MWEDSIKTFAQNIRTPEIILVLGASESLYNISDRFKSVFAEQTICYVKEG